MRIVVDINHPAHVHYFKNFIWEMEKRGHEILITASHKDVATELLHRYNLPFIDLGSYGSSLVKKILNLPIMDLKMYRAGTDLRSGCPGRLLLDTSLTRLEAHQKAKRNTR